MGLPAVLLIIFILWMIFRERESDTNSASVPAVRAETYSLKSLEPGQDFHFRLSENDISLSVPDGEGFSFGTFLMSVSGETDSVPRSFERDGSMETLMVDDFDQDGRPDFLIVIRSAGSGSYTSLHLFLNGPDGYVHSPLPEMNPLLPASLSYMGHDEIHVSDGIITCRFPAFSNDPGPRVDRQWRPDDLATGRLPVKSSPDSNASLSGKTVTMIYDLTSGQWLEQ